MGPSACGLPVDQYRAVGVLVVDEQHEARLRGAEETFNVAGRGVPAEPTGAPHFGVDLVGPFTELDGWDLADSEVCAGGFSHVGYRPVTLSP